MLCCRLISNADISPRRATKRHDGELEQALRAYRGGQHERGGWPWFPHANHGASGAVGMDFDEMDMNEMDGSGNVGLKEETRDEDVGFMRAGRPQT